MVTARVTEESLGLSPHIFNLRRKKHHVQQFEFHCLAGQTQANIVRIRKLITLLFLIIGVSAVRTRNLP